jgi:hypothetical protein
MVFDHQGPGMPSSPEEGTVWRIEGPRVFVTGYATCLDRLNMGISPFGHWLEVGSRKLDLVNAFGSDRLVSLAIKRTPLISIIVAEVRQWRNSPSKP